MAETYGTIPGLKNGVFRMRKFAIGIVSLAVILGVFVLYSRIDKTPPLEITTPGDLAGQSSDANSGSLNNIGKVSTSSGSVGIGPVEKLEYITRNDKGEIVQIWGFLRLLHTEGDMWELEQPYINIFRKEFTCSMKADSGIVKVEKVGDRTMPKDATFSGNVVINILPGKTRNIEECTITLENLSFISEKSQLSATGTLSFVSKTASLKGTGMEMIYNEDQERLEFFRIVDLDNLSVKIRQATLGTISGTDKTSDNSNSPDKNTQSQSALAQAQPVEDANSPKAAQAAEQYYTCLFSKNILIDTPDQYIFSRQEIKIDDIIWTHQTQDGNEPQKIVSETDPNQVENIAAEPNDTEIEPQDLVDVVITCDNGFIITPKGSSKMEDFRKASHALYDNKKPEFDDSIKKTILLTQNIQLTTLAGDSNAIGPTELIFYVEEPNNSDPNLRSIPVTISSQRGAQFLKAANKVIFNGDALCSIPQNDLSEERTATLSSLMLIINLPESKAGEKKALPDIIAIGPAELNFYVEDPNAAADAQKIVPIKITAQEKALYMPALNQIIFDKDCRCFIGSKEVSKEQFISLKSSNLKIDIPKSTSAKSRSGFAFSDIIAAGPIDLKFFMKDPNNLGTPQALLPVNITAKNYARYLSSSRQIVVDGSCKTSMLREDADFNQELTLLANQITVDLPSDINDNQSDPNIAVSRPASTLTEIRHLNADSNQVILKITKKSKIPLPVSSPIVIGQNSGDSNNDILGWTQLICRSLDYDTQEQVIQAAGPGNLILSDTEIKDPNADVNSAHFAKEKWPDNTGELVFGKTWWAETSGFSELKYLLNNNRIIANSEPGKPINIKYIELVNNLYSPVLIASAGHIEIELKKNEEGKTEPAVVVASGGIDYMKDPNNRFLGSVLYYDHEKDTVTIRGDEKNPCFYNGVLVDEISIDLKTGNVTLISTNPGSI
jgi:hypothetical protein